MARLEEFNDIIRRDEPLAPYTHLKLGGPAEMLAQPRSLDELSRLVPPLLRRAHPAARAGLRLQHARPRRGRRRGRAAAQRAGLHADHASRASARGPAPGASVSALISATARHDLAGLETLVGIPGTVGGALRTNAGDRSGDIGQFVRSVEVLDRQGKRAGARPRRAASSASTPATSTTRSC